MPIGGRLTHVISPTRKPSFIQPSDEIPRRAKSLASLPTPNRVICVRSHGAQLPSERPLLPM